MEKIIEFINNITRPDLRPCVAKDYIKSGILSSEYSVLSQLICYAGLIQETAFKDIDEVLDAYKKYDDHRYDIICRLKVLELPKISREKAMSCIHEALVVDGYSGEFNDNIADNYRYSALWAAIFNLVPFSKWEPNDFIIFNKVAVHTIDYFSSDFIIKYLERDNYKNFSSRFIEKLPRSVIKYILLQICNGDLNVETVISILNLHSITSLNIILSDFDFDIPEKLAIKLLLLCGANNVLECVNRGLKNIPRTEKVLGAIAQTLTSFYNYSLDFIKHIDLFVDVIPAEYLWDMLKDANFPPAKAIEALISEPEKLDTFIDKVLVPVSKNRELGELKALLILSKSQPLDLNVLDAALYAGIEPEHHTIKQIENALENEDMFDHILTITSNKDYPAAILNRSFQHVFGNEKYPLINTIINTVKMQERAA